MDTRETCHDTLAWVENYSSLRLDLLVEVRDIGLRQADDSDMARHAQREQQCVVTSDCDGTAIRNYPPQHDAGIVVLVIPPTVTATSSTQWLESFLVQPTLIAQ